MDVRNWLIDNGFDRFVEAFEFNEVDWTLLVELSNEDLKDLGVVKLADRKKFLAALASVHPDQTSGQSPQKITEQSQVLAHVSSVENRTDEPGLPAASQALSRRPDTATGTLAQEKQAQVHRQTQRRRTEAEYRQPSVMFCDLVGSTALATRFDAEEFRSAIRHCRRSCRIIRCSGIHRLG